MARRVILFGIDGLVLPVVEHFVRQGRLPHFARVCREGAVTKVLPFVSTWGPINFMSLPTGTSPGTAWQGSVDVSRSGSGGYAAETLWQALERQGRASAVISYPGASPW